MDFSMDYVYNAMDSHELKHVRIDVSPDSDGERLEMDITSADEIAIHDLRKILNSLWAERFSRLRISPVYDCNIRLIAAGKAYKVLVSQAEQGISVDSLFAEKAK